MKIFVYKNIKKSSEYCIYEPQTEDDIISLVTETYKGNCPNFGNKIWFQGIMSAIDNGENEFGFLDNTSPEYVNNNYDIALLPMANIFNSEYKSYIISLTDFFSRIKIPTYVIACGVQADSYDAIDALINSIGKESSEFISAIYNTGGEFALRGEFSKAFFEKLGFNTPVVTGCPSIFQMGPGLQISNKKVSKDEFKPLINGSIPQFKKYFSNYKNSAFIDQDRYYDILFSEKFKQPSKETVRYALKNYELYEINLAANDRIGLFPNSNDWYRYIIDNQFNFSFGTRIHGNIVPILAGVPSLLYAKDSRTQEMAEYFKIPTITKDKYHNQDLYELYEQTDYSEFNATFPERYKKFKDFLIDHKIVTHLNESNKFFVNKDLVIKNYPSKNDIIQLNKTIESSFYFKNYSRFLRLKEKFHTMFV